MTDNQPPTLETQATCESGSICQKIRKDAKIHLIFAAVLVVLVIAGYFPSGAGPKFEPVERKEIPAAASAETRVAIDKLNAEIDKSNAELRETVAKEQREWEKSGRENFVTRTMLIQFGAGLVAALWMVFLVCSYLVRPLLKFLKEFLGEDFAKVVTPLVILGIAYVLATIVSQYLSVKPVAASGFAVTVVNLVEYSLRPSLLFIINFTEFVVKNWTVGLVYLAIVIYAIIRKFKAPLP